MKEEKAHARCDECGCRIEIFVETETEGEIEKRFYRCPFCGTRYLFAVTDAALREKIAEYAKYSLAHRGRVMTEEELEVARVLMTENIRRCEELKFKHPLKGENDGGEHDH